MESITFWAQASRSIVLPNESGTPNESDTAKTAKTGTAETGTAKTKGLSQDFLTRLLRFVSWAPDWDGQAAEHISPRVARRALELALASLSFGPEPFVAPAPDGSLLLQWDLPTGESIEIYVSEEDVFDYYTLTYDGEVRELPTHSAEDFLAALHEHSGQLAIST